MPQQSLVSLFENEGRKMNAVYLLDTVGIANKRIALAFRGSKENTSRSPGE